MPRITDQTIDEVRSASDIVDVVSDRVRLKKQGRRFVGLCPFHNEKSPSFSVDPGEGLYYCFGCRRGGDTFKFIQEMEGVGFLDAVRLLADRAGIEIAEEGANPENDRKATLHAALRFAGRFYFEQLSTEAGARGLEYLKSRGFSPEAVKAFGIGVAPVGWDALVGAATKAGFDTQTLEDVGLAKPRSGGGHYDVFRDRLMFPILSPIGKVLGFGGRILPDTPTASVDYTPAKYINTPETEVYQKSRVLYGMKQAKRAIRDEGEAYLVEGYADVVGLHQAGIQNVVATSGTSISFEHIDLLKQYANKLVMVFDSDPAGLEAAWKAILSSFKSGVFPYLLPLPPGADPDSYVKKFGQASFLKLVSEYKLDAIDFITEMIKKQHSSLDKVDEAVSFVVRLVSVIGNAFDNPRSVQERLIRDSAAKLGVYEVDIRRKLEGKAPETIVAPRMPTPALAPEAAAPVVVPVRPQEHVLLRLMLRSGLPMVEHVLSKMGLDEFTAGPLRQAVQVLVDQYHAGAVDASAFVQGHHGEAVRALAVEALAEKHTASENWEKKMGMEIPGRDADPFRTADSAMRLLKLARVDEAIEVAKRRVLQAEREGVDSSTAQQEVVAFATLRQRIDRGELTAGAAA
ncbi:MAG: DNA primase [Bacteroidota bacterium]